MVVTMVAMRMMQTPINQKVNMVAVRHGGMATVRAVNMFRGAFRGGKARRAFVGIRGTDRNRVFVHMVTVRVMQMAVVQIIHMAVVSSCVPAAGAVDMGMVGVRGAGMLLTHRFVWLCVC